MTASTAASLDRIAQLANPLALEWVFAQPGSDIGLLPTNNFLHQIEELASSSVEIPEPITPTVTLAPETADSPDDEPLVLNLENDADLLREFINESQELLQNIELGVLTLEEQPEDADTLNSIFRAFHTFKGGSGFLNLKPISLLAHELEWLLVLARQGSLRIDSVVINAILAAGDTLQQFVEEIAAQLERRKPAQPIIIPIRPLVDQLRPIRNDLARRKHETPPADPVAAATRATRSTTHPTPARPSPAAMTEPPATPNPVCKPRLIPEKPASAPVKTNRSVVKVDTQKLDRLVDLVGEMVIAQSLVVQDPDLQRHVSQRLGSNLSQLARITRELQRLSRSLRMVPIRGTFLKMTRLVRDLAVQTSKQVVLEMSGEETELDRALVAELNDPLVHMIRNAVDHGIEAPPARVEHGKPASGRVQLRAFHQGGHIVIEIQDDGGGLNRDRILAKAVERGLTEPDAELSEEEIFNFIFAAGFSTADKVTDISGRGVGMDVVLRNIERLRGKISIKSILGQGCTFTIRLPLTLATIDGLLIRVGQDRFILPNWSVREPFRAAPHRPPLIPPRPPSASCS